MLVRVIGARMLPLSKTSGKAKTKRPYVVARLLGLDCDAREYRGNASPHTNIISPDWTDNSAFSFEMAMSEMALLLIKVETSSKTTAAYCCFPVNCLREGYRIAKLRNAEDGAAVNGSEILLHVTFITAPS